MKINKIIYSSNFRKQFEKLPVFLQNKTCEKIEIFRENPLHNSLRLHRLKGKVSRLWTISVDMRTRAIFQVLDDSVVEFLNIGSHSIYTKTGQLT